MKYKRVFREYFCLVVALSLWSFFPNTFHKYLAGGPCPRDFTGYYLKISLFLFCCESQSDSLAGENTGLVSAKLPDLGYLALSRTK